jgi:hypothetical protein
MIRDPSDGSVKEVTPDANDINEVKADKPMEGITSGLPYGSSKPKDIARLEASRAWLKNYLHRKQGT